MLPSHRKNTEFEERDSSFRYESIQPETQQGADSGAGPSTDGHSVSKVWTHRPEPSVCERMGDEQGLEN